MDQKLFKMINDLAGRNDLVDLIMVFASKKMRYIFAFVLFFMWLCDRPCKKIFYRSVISIMINVCLNFLIKQLKYRPRPFMTRKANLLLHSKTDSTYTSKHTLLTFAVSTTLYMYNKFIGIIMFGMAVITGVSRIWTGAHYPSDIVRSAFIGSMVSLVIDRFSQLKIKRG